MHPICEAGSTVPTEQRSKAIQVLGERRITRECSFTGHASVHLNENSKPDYLHIF